MIHHATVPTPLLHWYYNAQPNPLVEAAESAILMAACSRTQGVHILEVGTHRGGTTNAFARIAKALDGIVATVDVCVTPSTIPSNQASECLPIAEIGSLVEPAVKDWVQQIIYDPTRNDSRVGVLDALRAIAPFHVIFVDGDHSVEGVAADYRDYLPLLSTLGVMFFHDVWWDVIPPPVDGALKLLDHRQGYVLNLTHLGVTPEHLGRVL